MPKEVKVEDKTWRKRPFGEEGMMKDTNNPYPVYTEKTTVVKRDGKVRKKIVGVNKQGGVDRGKPDNEKSVAITKYDKSGKIKKKVSLVKDETGIIQKTVSRPGQKDVTRKPGLFANARINKNI